MTQEKEHPKDDKTAKRKVSKGEKLFDAIVYGGVNYVGTFILTIPVAYTLKQGALRERYNEAHSWLVGKGLNKRISTKLLDTTALMQGGNIMLVPIHYAEENKKGIIEGLNKALGDKTDISTIEEAPKQDWTTLLKSRALAWLAVFVSFTTAASVVGEEKFGEFEKWVGEKTAAFFKQPLYRMDKPTSKGDIGKVEPYAVLRAKESLLESKVGQVKAFGETLGVTIRNPHVQELENVGKEIAKYEKRTFAYGKFAAIDAFATAAAVALLYMGTRVFGKKHEDGHKDAASLRAPTRITVSKDAVAEEHVSSVRPAFAERISHEKEQAATSERGTAIG